MLWRPAIAARCEHMATAAPGLLMLAATTAAARGLHITTTYGAGAAASSAPSPVSCGGAFGFEVVHQSSRSRARVGRIHTPHGVIETPAFVPVGTNGALKGVTHAQAEALGVQLMFANTFHLLVSPGPSVVAEAGGLHRFVGRRGPIITDSGGFQIFSLGRIARDGDGRPVAERGELKSRSRYSRQDQACIVKVTEAGAVFRSYRDGSLLELTPESSVRAQKALGADIIVPLDELPSNDVSHDALQRSVARSHRWMRRSLEEHLAHPCGQAMFGVLHGGTDRALRAESAAFLAGLPFDGTAIGGSLGADRDEMLGLLRDIAPQLPETRPVHLLGIADDVSVGLVAPFGIDTFDSCWPTRVARHGTILARGGRYNLRRGRYARDFRPLDPDLPDLTLAASGCAAAGLGGVEGEPVTRAFMSHLLRQKEPLFAVLASMHNVAYMNWRMAQIREAILADEV